MSKNTYRSYHQSQKHLTNCSVAEQHFPMELMSGTNCQSLNQILPSDKQSIFSKRRSNALAPQHFLAFLLDRPYIDQKLDANTQMKKRQPLNSQRNYIQNWFTLTKFRTKSLTFIDTYYGSANPVHPADWWKLFDLEQPILDMVRSILSCCPSTAPLERLFSAFGWVMSTAMFETDWT